MPLPYGQRPIIGTSNYSYFLDWPEAIEFFISETLKEVVGLSPNNPVLSSSGRRLLDWDLNGTVDLADVLLMLKVAVGFDRSEIAQPPSTQFNHFFEAFSNHAGTFVTNKKIDAGGPPPKDAVRDIPYQINNNGAGSTGNDGIDMRLIGEEYGNYTSYGTPYSISDFYGAGIGQYKAPSSGTISFNDFFRTTNRFVYLGGFALTDVLKSRAYYTFNNDFTDGSDDSNDGLRPFADETNSPWLYRLYFCYRNGGVGTHWRGDFQLDYVNINDRDGGGATYVRDFGGDEAGWQFLPADEGSNNTYSGQTLEGISSARNSSSWRQVVQGTNLYDWNRYNATPPSSQVGINGGYNGTYYLYAETSGTNTYLYRYWLRSDPFTLSGSQDRLQFAWSSYNGAASGNRGRFDVWLVAEHNMYSPVLNSSNFTSDSFSLRTRIITLPTNVPYNKDVRVYFKYKPGTSGTSFRGDFQIIDARFEGNGTQERLPDLQNNSSGYSGDRWQTFSCNTNRFVENIEDARPLFVDMANGSTSSLYQWNRRIFSTPSSGTGISYGSAYYFYAETSGSASVVRGNCFWLRSPVKRYYRGHTQLRILYYSYGDSFGSSNDKLEVYVVAE